MLEKDVIEAAGFDLDGTLYRSTPEMDDRIRTEFAKHILEIKPDLKSLEKARQFFESHYAELQSGKKVLTRAGYRNASEIGERCLVEADITDLLQKDPTLSTILKEIQDRYEFMYLITSSPQDLALKKLDALGINPEVFDHAVFSDTPRAGDKQTGSSFRYLLKVPGCPKAPNHVYVGDRLKSDITPAYNLRMQTIAITWNPDREIPQASLSIPHIHDVREHLL